MSLPRLYDLAGADPAIRFSPYCWRIRLALAHKGIAVETIPWRFTDKAAIGFSGQGKVPVLVDGETVVFDSERIADHLEARHPDRPSLFGGAAGRALARFLHHWTVQMLHPEIARLVVPDLFPRLAEPDRAYFRASREAAFGLCIEELPAQRPERLAALARALAPLRALLETQPYLSGTAPLYADHIVFGAFQWARVASPLVLVAPEDPVAAWRERMLDAYGGLGRAMAAAA